MSTLNVGAMAARLGLDPSEFLEKMKGVEGFATASGQRIANEMKRTNREGAESLRLIDEALGVHLSRPITRIVTQEFPGLAKGLQEVLGFGVAAGIGIAAFDAIEKGFERVGKAIDDAKKKEDEFVASTHALQMVLNRQSIDAANDLDRVAQKMAELHGDKWGALDAQLRILSREDALRAVSDIDSLSEAYKKNAKAAADATTMTAQFWRAVGSQTTSVFDKANERITKQGQEIRNKFDEIVTGDPEHGLQKGMDFLQKQLDQAKKTQAEMHANQLSTLDKYLAGLSWTDDIVAKRGAHTKEEVKNYDALVASLDSQVKKTHELIDADKGKKTVARAETASSADIGDKQISKLKAETEAELLLAAAVDKTTGAQFLAKAAGEADQIIARVQEEAHGKLTAAMQRQLQAVNALTVERDLAKDITAVSGEMQKQTEEIDRNIASATKMAAAYLKGGQAIEDAKIDQRLAPEIQKLDDLTKKYDAARKAADDYAAARERLGKAAGPLPGIDIPTANLDQLKKDLDHQQEVVNQQKLNLQTADLAAYQEEINKTADSLRGEQPYLDTLNDSYLRGAEAVRKAQVALALFHWEQSHFGGQTAADISETLASSVHPDISSEEARKVMSSKDSTVDERAAAQARLQLDQIAEVSAQLNQQSVEQQRSADARAAAEYSVSVKYDDELQKLQRIREVLQQNGESTLRIDAAIEEAQDRNLKQWDDAAFRVGTFGDKFTAVMNEVQIRADEASKQMAEAWVSAIENVNSELAKLATGQKTDFKKIIISLSEEQTKGELAKADSWIAQQFGLKIPGLEGKPDGSQSKPLHVIVSGAAGGATPPPLAGSSPLQAAASIFNGFSSSGRSVTPALGAVAAAQPSQNGALADLNALTAAASQLPDLSNFGGFLAGGGDVKSGTSYVVGEKGPEIFTSSTSGRVIPHDQSFTFDPHAAYARNYEHYERWLHRGESNGPFFASLLSLAGNELFKGFHIGDKLLSIFHHSSPGAVAAGLPASSGVLSELDSLTASVSPSGTSAGSSSSALPNMTKPGDIDAGYLSNWAREYSMPAMPEMKMPSMPDLGAIAAQMPSQNGSLADLDKLTASIQIPDFGGFRAEGGDVMAGMNYLVGERGPELLRIPAMGSIVANHDLKNIGGLTDNSRTTHVTQNFNGPKDSDGFRRSVRQENARMLRHFR